MACAAFLIFLLLMSRTIEYSVRIMTENFIILQVKFWGTSTTDIDLIAKNILEYMIDLERFGWPPTCTSILYQPERPLELYDKTDLQNIKGTQIKNK